MQNCCRGEHPEIRDYGPEPFVFNINHATNMNRNFRTTLWTGCDMQLTLMSIPAKCDIGVEMHEDVDRFIRIESGCARVYMGESENALCEVGSVNESYAIIIPAGTWHNVVNVGSCPLKLYSLYAPPYDVARDIYRAWFEIIQKHIRPHLYICGHYHLTEVRRPPYSLDEFGIKTPLVVASKNGKAYFCGSGFDVSGEGVSVVFTDSDAKKSEPIII